MPASTYVWKTWVASTSNTASTTSYSSSSGQVWSIWCDSATATTSSSSNGETVWLSWNDGQAVRVQGYRYNPVLETEEQKQARLAWEERARLEWEERARLEAEERRRKEAEAKEKAERLLISQLNAVQLQQLKDMDAFMVELQTKRYKVRRGQKVIELDKEGKQVAQYCIHPSDYNIPAADVMLSQKLLLEHDEAAFLRIANRTPMLQ